jgi:hypothetical protein
MIVSTACFHESAETLPHNKLRVSKSTVVGTPISSSCAGRNLADVCSSWVHAHETSPSRPGFPVARAGMM